MKAGSTWLLDRLGQIILLGCPDNSALPGALQCCLTAPCRLSVQCDMSTAPSSFFNNPQAVPSLKAELAVGLGCSQCWCPQCCCISYTRLREDRARNSLCWGSQSLFCLILEDLCGKGIWWIADIWVTFFILAVKWMSSRQLQTQFGAFRLETTGEWASAECR